MILFPNCKINLGLNILRRRADGYHDIETFMVPVDWQDVLEIVPANNSENTSLTVYGNNVDCPVEKNLVYKAYCAVKELFDIPAVDIYLEKIIPDGAGLGGGSSDAAFTIKGLNQMFDLGMSDDEMAVIAGRLGADCPMFIYNRPMLATGTGTTLSNVDVDLSNYYVLIVKPQVKVPTAEAYACSLPFPWVKPVRTFCIDILSKELINDFEYSVFALHPELAQIKQQLLDSGALYASMSGSGSAIFGVYATRNDAEHASTAFNEADMVKRVCKFI